MMKKYSYLIVSLFASCILLANTPANANSKQLEAKSLHFTAQASDCFHAANNCLLEVNPSALINNNRFYNIAQLCDGGFKYSYEHLNTQIQNRKIIGTEFCKGIVSLSNMEVPYFSSHSGFQNANDGLLLLAYINHAIKYIAIILSEQQNLAVSAASGQLTPDDLSNTITQFNALLNELNRVANDATVNGLPALDGNNKQVMVAVDHWTKQIVIPLFNLTTGNHGLNIASLSLETVDQANIAIAALQNAKKYLDNVASKIFAVKPDLLAAAKRDEIVTTVDLTGEEFIVKRSGNSFNKNSINKKT